MAMQENLSRSPQREVSSILIDPTNLSLDRLSRVVEFSMFGQHADEARIVIRKEGSPPIRFSSQNAQALTPEIQAQLSSVIAMAMQDADEVRISRINTSVSIPSLN